MTGRVFENNPFYDLKSEITFDKVYKEKDFEKDCLRIAQTQKAKLLNDDNIELLSKFLIARLKEPDRNIKKIAKVTIKYMTFLRRLQKRDGLNKK